VSAQNQGAGDGAGGDRGPSGLEGEDAVASEESIGPDDATPAAQTPDDDGSGATAGPVSVEELVVLVETLTAERDGANDARMRLQAEFENYRKRVAKQELDTVSRAAEGIVTKLLPALDAFDAALAMQVDGIEPIWNSLWGVLNREGLDRLDPVDEPFDPTCHEAVLREDGGDGGVEVVAETLRTGYSWKGRVVRPAMVKVRT